MDNLIYISHRVNTIDQLKETSEEYGVEVDLRDYNDKLVLQHDPFIGGECFEDFLEHYKHNFIILNIKSERIEHKVLELMKKHDIKNYFFLDSSFPMIFQLIKSGESRIALRYSEFEGIDTLMNLKDKVDWVWVDCFNDFPLSQKTYDLLKQHFKLCLVSPELQTHPLSLIPEFATKLKKMPFQAICTKHVGLWKKHFR
jgi:hypothetical protein